MSTPHEPGAGGPYCHNRHGRKMSRRRSDAAKRKKRQPFQPDFHGLEKRMMPATFLVNTTADSGAGSLRQAILDSNATPGSNTIDFGIGTGAQTISLLSALPNITVPVLIDGTTQPGYTSAPLIDLDGTSAGSGANGLDLAAGSGGSTIRALVINNFSGDGISITTTGNIVQSSYIGTNAAGTAAGSQPMADGILVTAAQQHDRRHRLPAPATSSRATPATALRSPARPRPATSIEGNLIGTDIDRRGRAGQHATTASA